jgi:hypothetical protein
LHGTEAENYQGIRTLAKGKVDAQTATAQSGDRWMMTTTLENTSSTPLLNVRLKVVREKTGDRILPAIYSDGYIALMPGEKRTIATEVYDADTRGERPRIEVEGFNLSAR